MSKSVAVLGGGNGAHAASADLALRGFDVHMYEDERFASHMQTVFDTQEIEVTGACGDAVAHISMVTTDLKKAVEGVTCIIVTVPAFAHSDYAKKLAEVVVPGQIVFVLPGTFGSLIFWKVFQEKGIKDVVVAETHTLPYATRLCGPGKSLVMSLFDPLKVGVIPANKTKETMEELSQYYDCLEPVESVLACGLSSLNPIIHVPGCILNAGRIEVAKGEFFFYTEGFSDCVVRTTEAIDLERISILQALGYQSDIAAHGIGGSIQSDSIKEVIANDPNFAKIKGPADIKNRYYSEDIPYGIASWAKLAKLIDLETPIMDSMVNIGNILLNMNCWESGRSLAELGIEQMNKEALLRYLEKGE